MTDTVQRIVWHKKNLTSGDAKKHSENIVGKRLKLKETKTNFEFRILPKTKFEGKLKKITLNPDMIVFVGKLKSEHQHLQGSGMFSKAFSYAKDLWKKGSNLVKKNLPSVDTVINTTKKVIDKGSEVLFKSDEPTQGKFVRDKRMPDNKILWKMAIESYNKQAKENVDSWKLIHETDTLKFYAKGNVCIISIRGTNDKTDIKADIQSAVGDVEKSKRWKTDIQVFKDYPKLLVDFDVVFGVSHSLGSMIMDLFIERGIISQGISYNGAVEKKFMGSNKNYRVYLNENEAIYQVMGKYANPESREVRETSPIKKVLNDTGDIGKASVALQSHLLSNFEGGKRKCNCKCLCGAGIPDVKPITATQKKAFMKLTGFKEIMNAYIDKKNSDVQSGSSGGNRADALLKRMKDGSFMNAMNKTATDNGQSMNALMKDVYDQSDFWDDTKDWFKKAGTDVNQFLKDNKVLSTVAGIGSALVSIIPGVDAIVSPLLATASAGAEELGYGKPVNNKPITEAQKKKLLKIKGFKEAMDRYNAKNANLTGSGWWDDTKNWFNKAGTDINQFLKDNKVLSTVAGIGSALVSIIPGVDAIVSPLLATASAGAEELGYGKPKTVKHRIKKY